MKQYKILIKGIHVGREIHIEGKVFHFHCVGTKDRARQEGPYPQPYDSKEEVNAS